MASDHRCVAGTLRMLIATFLWHFLYSLQIIHMAKHLLAIKWQKSGQGRYYLNKNIYKCIVNVVNRHIVVSLLLHVMNLIIVSESRSYEPEL